MPRNLFDRELLKNSEFRIAIFGSARVKKGDRTYNLVFQLAKMIGSRNLDVVTGGGPGLMEAANTGHIAGDTKHTAHSLGLLIKVAREKRHKPNLNIKKEFDRFSARLDTFMSLSNAVVVAPGGLGTLLELFYTWQLIQVKQICNIPIILLGDHYRELIDWVRRGPLKHQYLDKEDMSPIFFAKDAKQAMKIIDKAYEDYKQGGKKICLNLKKYKLR